MCVRAMHPGAVESPKRVGMAWGGPFNEEIPDLKPESYARNTCKK